MHNTLTKKPHKNQGGIVNLNILNYREPNVVYFDSYGNLKPPKKTD